MNDVWVTQVNAAIAETLRWGKISAGMVLVVAGALVSVLVIKYAVGKAMG